MIAIAGMKRKGCGQQRRTADIPSIFILKPATFRALVTGLVSFKETR